MLSETNFKNSKTVIVYYYNHYSFINTILPYYQGEGEGERKRSRGGRELFRLSKIIMKNVNEKQFYDFFLIVRIIKNYHE